MISDPHTGMGAYTAFPGGAPCINAGSSIKESEGKDLVVTPNDSEGADIGVHGFSKRETKNGFVK